MSTRTRTVLLSRSPGPLRRTAAEEIGASDRTRQVAAAQAAGAHAFVAELPEGYHTPIDAAGIIVTPSQRLRLAVARALAADPHHVVLDDPTGDLDAAGEAAALPGLEALLRGRSIRVERASPAVRALVERVASDPSGQHGPHGPHPVPPAVAALAPDPALPGLATLLDGGAMSPMLARSLGGDGLPDVRVTSVRYKPGDNVVVQYAVGTPDGWTTAVAFAHGSGSLKGKARRTRNRRLAARARDRSVACTPLAHAPELGALVQWLPVDVRLPLLSEPGAKLVRRLAKRGLEVDTDDVPELLRYWPRRRAVLGLGRHVVKVYRDDADYAQARRGLRLAGSLRRVRTAPYEGASTSQRLTVQGRLPGDSPSMSPRDSAAAGALVADLHSHRLLELPTATVDDILAKAAIRASFVGTLLPSLQEPLATLMTELAATAPPSLSLVISHGNYHAGQLLATPDGLALIDLDRLSIAAPAYDLASFAAHVAFGRPGELDLVVATLDSLVAGYGARPEGLCWFLATCLLRRAPVALRFQDEHWPDAMAALVASAQQALR